MRLRPVSLIAAREIDGAVRNRWLLFAGGGFFLLALGLSMLGLAGADRSGLAGFDRTTASLLNLALLFVPLVTLPIGGLSIAAELEDGSLSQLLAQPVTRAEAWLGKWLGLYVAVSASLLLGFGAAGAVVAWRAGGAHVGSFVGLVGLLLLYSAATLSLGALVSIGLRSRAKAIGAAFGLWLGMVYLADLGSIGLSVLRELRPGQLFTVALLNPAAQARVLGTVLLADRLDVLGPVGIFGQETFGSGGLVALLVTALVAVSAGALGLGYALLRKAVVP